MKPTPFLLSFLVFLGLLPFWPSSAQNTAPSSYEKGEPTITIQQAIATAEKAMKESGRDLNKYVLFYATWTQPTASMKRDASILPILAEYGNKPFWAVRFLQKGWTEEMGEKTGDPYNLGLTLWVYSTTSVAFLNHSFAPESGLIPGENPHAPVPEK